MTDQRVTRHEPVTISVSIGDKEVEFKAAPLPWRKRIDLGDALNTMYAAALNAELQAVRDDNNDIVGVSGSLFERAMDYDALFHIAYSTYEVNAEGEIVLNAGPPKELLRAFGGAGYDDMLAVIEGALQANGLERLSHLLDPDRKKDLTTGASEPATQPTTDAGEKTGSPTESG